MKKAIRITKSNWAFFGPRYVFWDIIYHSLNLIYNKTKKKDKLKKKELVEKRVNNYKMLLNKNGEGIERDLVINGIRESISTEIMDSWCKEGDYVLDLGANIGYYTILCSKKVKKKGKVYSIEPGKENYSLLKRNIKLNNLENVESKKAAFANYSGDLKIYISEAGNYNSPVPKEEYKRIEKIPCYTLDSFFKKKKKPTIIKMDVEGYEYEILAGGKEILNDVEKIFVELHFPLVDKKKMVSLLKLLKNKRFEITKMILEWERNVSPDTILGRLVNWAYNKRSRKKIYSDIKIDDLINSKRILEGHLSYEVFLEKKNDK